MTSAYIAPAARWFAADASSPERAALIKAADGLIERGLWCVVEVCVDVPRQVWERRLAILRSDGAGVADAVAEWVWCTPELDVRLNGCRRTDLGLAADAPTHLCYVAGAAKLAAR